MDKFEHLVGQIYDCAANPALWPSVLMEIRDISKSAYVMIAMTDTSNLVFGQPLSFVALTSGWDDEWLQKLQVYVNQIPGGEAIYANGIDVAWTQMSQIREDDFQKTQVYLQWVEPQKLRDCMALTYIQRKDVTGVISAPTHMGRDLYTKNDEIFFERLSPHIRRAIMINDLVDKGKLTLALYRKVLDSLSVAVFVVGLGQRLITCNAAAEDMLSNANFVKLSQGALKAQKLGDVASAFELAIERATKGDTSIGISGIGVPMLGVDGDRAAAYVLPIGGKEIRGDLGDGYAAIFVARRGEQQPMAIEILRTVFDLTPAEARISTLVAKGFGPAVIAESLGVSLSTVRTHLAHIFSKTGAADQLALSSVVNALLPPIG